MTHCLIKLVLTFRVSMAPMGLTALLALGGLTACTTAPVVTVPRAAAASPRPAVAAVLPDSALPTDASAGMPLPSVADGPRPALLDGEPAREFQRGGASWYGPGFHGRRTASGERYDMHALTAAHRTLPFGTLVRVHSLVNGREVEVRITDRGPYSHGRIIDVSRAAAEALGMLGLGFKEVVLMVPESTPAVAAQPPAAPARRRPAARRRAPG